MRSHQRRLHAHHVHVDDQRRERTIDLSPHQDILYVEIGMHHAGKCQPREQHARGRERVLAHHARNESGEDHAQVKRIGKESRDHIDSAESTRCRVRCETQNLGGWNAQVTQHGRRKKLTTRAARSAKSISGDGSEETTVPRVPHHDGFVRSGDVRHVHRGAAAKRAWLRLVGGPVV